MPAVRGILDQLGRIYGTDASSASVCDRLSNCCRVLPRLATALGFNVALAACSFTYTDSTGAHHIIGLVDYSVKAPAHSETLAGEVLEVTTIGVSVGQSAQGGYVTAGFSRETTAALRDNALVLGNPVTELAAAKPQHMGEK